MGSIASRNCIVLDDLAIGFVDRLLHDFGHDRAAIKALQVRNRDLARTEPFDARLGLHLGELAFDPRREVGGGKHHLEFALQTLRVGFRDFHFKETFSTSPPLTKIPRLPDKPPERQSRPSKRAVIIDLGRCRGAPVNVWCGRRDSNPHDFHHRNLNPARLPVPPRPLAPFQPSMAKTERLALYSNGDGGAQQKTLP